MEFHNLHQHMTVVANMEAIPDDAITSDITPDMQKAEDYFVRGLGEMEKDTQE